MGIFGKTVQYLKDHLDKTRDKISTSLKTVLTLGRKIDEDLLDELEEVLITFTVDEYIGYRPEYAQHDEVS